MHYLLSEVYDPYYPRYLTKYLLPRFRTLEFFLRSRNKERAWDSYAGGAGVSNKTRHPTAQIDGSITHRVVLIRTTGVPDIPAGGRSSFVSWLTFGRHVRVWCFVCLVPFTTVVLIYPVPRLVPGPQNFLAK